MAHGLRQVCERLLRDHVIPLAAAGSFALLALAIADASRSIGVSQQQRRALQTLCAGLAAEEAAFAAIRAKTDVPARSTTSWGLAARTERIHEIEERLVVTIETGKKLLRFWCESLRGAAPSCFGRRLTLGEAGRAGCGVRPWLRGATEPVTGSLPQLALPPVIRDALPGLFCDSEVAFLNLPSGSDRTDFTLGVATDQITPSPEVSLVEVRGNLWVLPSPQPLSLVLRAPLTLVVRGNVYLGRSITVVGHGPLTIVAHRTGATFRDLDGDGARGAHEPLLGAGSRCVEGEGALYLGMPRVSPQPEISIDAHLVATGEIHLLATSHVHGALVGAHDLTRCNDAAELSLSGRLLAHVDRIRIPGFATSGGPRPGRLHRLPAAAE